MSKLFSEIYGCYFDIVSRILSRAADGINKKDISDIINEHGFSETAFHLLPRLIDGEWNFLEKQGDLYYSKFAKPIDRPLSTLELSWLAALLKDSKIKLFLNEEKYKELELVLKDVTPVFDIKDFISLDRHLDGDPYDNSAYIANFREILKATKNNCPVIITYDSEKTGRSQRTYHPFKLSYSELNDKFRLLCVVFNTKTQKLNKITLNLAKIVSIQPSNIPYRVSFKDLCSLFTEQSKNPPIILEITKERNTLERFLLQFASFDRKTEHNAKRDIYTCQISYDMADEAELLIRILSFGPTLKVLGPQNFLDKIKERLTKQFSLKDISAS